MHAPGGLAERSDSDLKERPKVEQQGLNASAIIWKSCMESEELGIQQRRVQWEGCTVDGGSIF
jgi:hypothetical protein